MDLKKSFIFRLLTILFALCFMIDGSVAMAQRVQVKGYYRKDGTYVRPHTRSYPSQSSSTSSTYTPPTSSTVTVDGYYRKDGTYVRPHTRSYPSSSNTSSITSNGASSQSSIEQYDPSVYSPYEPPEGLNKPQKKKTTSYQLRRPRAWTSANGEKQIRARFVGEVDEKYIMLKDNVLKKAPKSGFKQDDIDFVSQCPDSQFLNQNFRTWTFKDGTTVEAKYVGKIEIYIVLMDKDGDLHKVKKSTLSKEDLDFIKANTPKD